VKVKFSRGRSDQNYHDWRTGKGVAVLGPKLRRVKLGVHAPSTGYRFIFYFPSGAWWYVDVYFDRRARPKGEQ
jgi:hypothetical protein